MPPDCRAVLWLKIRHLRTEVVRFGHFTGSDLLDETDFSDRVYQFYALGFVVLTLVFMWFFLLDQVTSFFSAAPVDFAFSVLQLAVLMPYTIFLLLGIWHVRSTPLKLTAPDISFLASSDVRQSFLFLVEAVKASIVPSIGGLLVGYVVGTGLSAAFSVSGIAFDLALFGAASLPCAVFLAWLLGAFRLLVQPVRRMLFSVATIVILCLVGGCAWLPFSSGMISNEALLLVFSGSGHFVVSLIFVALTLLMAFFLSRVARKVDMTDVIKESWFYTEMYSLRHMALQDSLGYADIKRSKQVMLRGPRGSITFSQGPSALIAHSWISFRRQFMVGMPSLLMWSVALAPLGVALLLGLLNPIYLTLWVVFLMGQPGNARELSRVSREDARNKTMYDHLPFGLLKIVVLDSLIPFSIAALISVIAVIVLSFMLPLSLGWGVCLVVLLNIVLVLCGALERAEFSSSKWSPSYEVGLVLVLVFLGGAAFSGISAVVCAAELFLIGLFAYTLHSSN